MDCLEFGIVRPLKELNEAVVPVYTGMVEVVTEDGDLLQLTKDYDSKSNYRVTNAMDGYGNNCLSKYLNSTITTKVVYHE